MRICIFIFLLIFSSFSFLNDSFSSRFPREYFHAKQILFSKLPLADSVCNTFGLKIKQVLPIALPECARYSILSDKIESSANYYLYATLGSSCGNFSIGHFQMKPTFIEQLEREVLKNSELKLFTFIHDYGKTEMDEETIRKKRLHRLESEWWQMRYLCCFYRLMESKYPALRLETEDEKLLFFSAAYNVGFNHSEKQIREWINRPSFPSGKIEPKKNFPYATVALEFSKDPQILNYR